MCFGQIIRPILLLSAVCLLAADPAIGVWSPKHRVTRTAEAEEYPRIAVAGCTVHAIWIDFESRSLHYAGSFDAGNSWSEARILAHGEGLPVLQAEIAVPSAGSQVDVVWQQGAYDEGRIFHRRSGDDGATWSTTRLLSRAGKASEQPTMAAGSDSVAVAWLQTRRGSDTKPVKLIFTRSSGQEWLEPRRIDRRSRGLSSPLLAVGDGTIHLFWGRRLRRDGMWSLELLHRASGDGGRTWLPRSRVVDGGWRAQSAAVSDTALHLLWEDTAYKQAFVEYQRSHDGERTWSDPRTLDEASFASLGVQGEQLEAVWVRNWDGTGSTFYSRSADGGTSWPVRRQIMRAARFPMLTVEGSGIGPCGGVAHVVFGKRWTRNGVSLQEIFHKRSPKVPDR